MAPTQVLVTGGAGYIGSHTCVELLHAGYDVTVFDNFSNSHPEALSRVGRIAGRDVSVIRGDVRDKPAIKAALLQSGAQSVIHFAGLKAVGESVTNPLLYQDNNVVGSLVLLEAMRECGVSTLVFSSSATVYGEPRFLPYTELHPLAPMNPYGRTKLFVEEILCDLHASDPAWSLAILRYFNPVGAHESGLIGEDPQGVPNNLMPFVAQVAVGKREFLNVWGGDYETPDGTGIRDYLHVVDLAIGHVKALEKLSADTGKCLTVNLGTGQGASVLEVVRSFEKASGREIPYRIAPRRSGDLPAYYADPTSAERILGWRAQRDLAAMCADTWKWQQANPSGYLP